MKINVFLVFISLLVLQSCNSKEHQKTGGKETTIEKIIQNEAHQMVLNMINHVGDFSKLVEKKDVAYTYSYTTPDGKQDISKEKYIFDKELSYGKYIKNERTLPQLKAPVEQGYDGHDYWLKSNGEIIDDEKMLKRVLFSRPTNYYWFTMMQKLADPNLNYEFLGEVKIAGDVYNIVKVTFNTDNEKPTDIYQLYINKETQLVDQFLFTVADFGKMEIPFLMQLEYEEIDGLKIPTKRKYKASSWDATVSEDPWITVNWTEIQFNNGFSKEDFKA